MCSASFPLPSAAVEVADVHVVRLRRYSEPGITGVDDGRGGYIASGDVLGLGPLAQCRCGSMPLGNRCCGSPLFLHQEVLAFNRASVIKVPGAPCRGMSIAPQY